MEGVPTLDKMVFEEEMFKAGSEEWQVRSIGGAEERDHAEGTGPAEISQADSSLSKSIGLRQVWLVLGQGD